jgi:hypothetical protein
MSDTKTTTVLKIAECGHDESWLRDQIYNDPNILGLGDLQVVTKEFIQPQGGRLDLLLKNPEDDSMFEIELQLGATNPDHIIRTIEYWDSIKRKWPNRSHTAVLVAEKITGRFFNVVQLLSMAVPFIGIQANMVRIEDTSALHFQTVIDCYEEQEEEEPVGRSFDEKHWRDNYPGALQCAQWYRNLFEAHYGDIPTKYFENYISLTVGGKARVWVAKRKNDKALVEVYIEQNMAAVIDRVDRDGIPYKAKDDVLMFNVNLQQLNEKKTIHEWIAQRVLSASPTAQ